MAEEGADCGEPARDRRRCETIRSELGNVGGEVIGARFSGRPSKPAAEVGEIAPVRLDRARREPRSGEGEKALDGLIGLLGHAR